jgi:flagellar assembly factor FliW
MRFETTRFGWLDFEADDVLLFPEGLLGMEECRQWLLLQEAQNDAMAWLQSLDRSEIALAVVSPRRFVPDYRIRVARSELTPLEIDELRGADILVIVGRTDRSVTLNLKAPLVLNASLRRGRQVITNGELPIRHELRSGQVALKKSA